MMRGVCAAIFSASEGSRDGENSLERPKTASGLRTPLWTNAARREVGRSSRRPTAARLRNSRLVFMTLFPSCQNGGRWSMASTTEITTHVLTRARLHRAKGAPEDVFSPKNKGAFIL